MIAKARVRGPDEVGPGFICCEGLRKATQDVAGTLVDIDLGQSSRETRACNFCGTMHRIMRVKLVEPVGRCTSVAMEWLDIDEGPALSQ